MPEVSFTLFPASPALSRDVETMRVGTYAGHESLSVTVCPNGLPGLASSWTGDAGAIESLSTRSASLDAVPPLFLHGQGAQPGVMRFVPRPFTSIQVAFRAFGLHTILGIDATDLVLGMLTPAQFDAVELDEQLRRAPDVGERVTLLQDFLERRLAAGPPRDEGIEAVIAYIEAHPSSATVTDLLEVIHTSERQLQRRFARVVGGTPKQYIRVKRVNEALRLIRSGEHGTLADVAHALNYYDQSHFIRDLRELSWATPRSLAQRVTEFHHDAGGASYEEGGFSQFMAAPPP